MSTIELDTYLLNNWMDLESAASRANALDEEVLTALETEVRNWADAQQWSGVFAQDNIWLAPPEWTSKAGKRPDADAYFQLAYYGPSDDLYWLTSLMGLNQDVAGFQFRQTRMNARTWKLRSTSPEALSAMPGFTIQSGNLFYPWRLELGDVLEAAAGGDYANVATSVTAVLDRLQSAVPVLSQLLGEAE